MIIDSHVHYGFLFFPVRHRSADDVIKIMDKYRIDISVMSNIKGIFYDFRNCNQEMYDDIKKYPGRLRGYIVVNPNYLEESLNEIEKFSKNPQFVGVKVHASWHNQYIDSPAFEPLFQKCEDLNLPVLVHSYVVDEYSDHVSAPERIANVARRHDIPIIVAHMGGNFKKTIKAIKGMENLYADISHGRERTSQLYVWEEGRVSEPVEELGAHRVLFGTDMPLIDPALLFGMMEDAGLSGHDTEMIMWKNAARIFNINVK